MNAERRFEYPIPRPMDATPIHKSKRQPAPSLPVSRAAIPRPKRRKSTRAIVPSENARGKDVDEINELKRSGMRPVYQTKPAPASKLEPFKG
jgi:hypothetical protein